MNLGTKYTHRITLRLTDEQYDFLLKLCKIMDISPSDYIRMCISTAQAQYGSDVSNMISEAVGGTSINENVKTDINNQL